MSTPPIRLAPMTVDVIVADLADAAKRAGNDDAVSCICSIAANLIASSGLHGSEAQARMMDTFRVAGFDADYYSSSVRVSYQASSEVRGAQPSTASLLAEAVELLKTHMLKANVGPSQLERVTSTSDFLKRAGGA